MKGRSLLFVAAVRFLFVEVACADTPIHARTLARRQEAERLEHIVLANCLVKDGKRSSEMAYFVGNQSGRPEGFAIVSIGEYAKWEDAELVGALSGNSGTFTSNLKGGLGIEVEDYAGTGRIDSRDFTCWKRTLPDLYKDEANTRTWSGVYACNHGPLPTPSVSSPNSIPFDISKPRPSSKNADPSSSRTSNKHDSSESNFLKFGLAIGSIVGGIGAVLAVSLAALMVLWRRHRRQRKFDEIEEAWAAEKNASWRYFFLTRWTTKRRMGRWVAEDEAEVAVVYLDIEQTGFFVLSVEV